MLGEIEAMQLLTLGTTHKLDEFAISVGMVTIEVCKRCRCILITRECIAINLGADRKRVPNKMVQFVVANYIAHLVNTLLH